MNRNEINDSIFHTNYYWMLYKKVNTYKFSLHFLRLLNIIPIKYRITFVKN